MIEASLAFFSIHLIAILFAFSKIGYLPRNFNQATIATIFTILSRPNSLTFQSSTKSNIISVHDKIAISLQISITLLNL